MENTLSHVQPGDPTVVNRIVGQLKSQGIFDEFRRDCIADFDTKPAYQNVRQRVEIYVSKFLSQQTWCTDLNKNQLRDTLRRSINESGMLAWGMDHLVEQVVTPKIYQVFYPKIETIVKEYLGLESKKNEESSVLPPLPPEKDQEKDKDLEMKPPEPKDDPKDINISSEEIKISFTEKITDDSIQNPTVEKTQVSPKILLTKIPNEINQKTEDILTETNNSEVIENEIGDHVNVETFNKVTGENKKSSEEKKFDKRQDQENQNALEKVKKERNVSESSDKEMHSRTEAIKKSGSHSTKNEREKKCDKHKLVEKEKAKIDCSKTKEIKKYENEKLEKKIKSNDNKSVPELTKLKSGKTQDSHGKYQKSKNHTRIKSSHDNESLKLQKSDIKSKLEPHLNLSKLPDSKKKSVSKSDKSQQSKNDIKTKIDQEKKSVTTDSKLKLSSGSITKYNKHTSTSKHSTEKKHSKHEGKSNQLSTDTKSGDSKSHLSSSGHKMESDKCKSTLSDKKTSEKYKSNEKLDDSANSNYFSESKRLKLDKKSAHKKIETNKLQLKHSEKERKNSEGKENENESQKKSKFKIYPKEKLGKTDSEKHLERKISSEERKCKSGDKLYNIHKNSKDKDKKNETTKESKQNKDLAQVKMNDDLNIVISSELSSSKLEIETKIDDDDENLNKLQRQKIFSNSDIKESDIESTCYNFSPEVFSESESKSEKESDISETIRPILGTSPSEEISEDTNGIEKGKEKFDISLPKDHPAEEKKPKEMESSSMENSMNIPESTQVGIASKGGWYK